MGLKLDGSPHTFQLSNSYATDRVGWRELLVARGDGVAVRSTDASVADRTHALTHYPTDLLHSPPDVRSETTVAALGSGGLAVQAIPAHDEYAPAEASSSAKSDGGFVSLIENGGQLSALGRDRRARARARVRDVPRSHAGARQDDGGGLPRRHAGHRRATR